MLNLLFCGNRSVFDGILTASLSVVKRMENPRPLNVIIFTMDVSRLREDYLPLEQKHADFIEKALRVHNPRSSVRLVDVTALYEEHLYRNANEDCYCSPYSLLRLLADLVDDMPEKLLYLDCDILLNRDICLLYDVDITNYEYAASRDHYGKFLLYPNYINAGVLLFNMPVCRESGLFNKAREWLKKKKMLFADQSALIRSTTKKKVLSQRFNDQKFLRKKTVVRHFSKRLFYLPYPRVENVKQWQVDKVRKVFKYKCFDDIFDEYLLLKEQFKEVYDNETTS